MALVAVLMALVACTICAGSPAPMIPGDNSHYVEGESRYIWMPDGDGTPHLVDLHESPAEEELQRLERNGAENQYWLFTRQNRNGAQVLVHNNAGSVSSSNYRGNRPLKVIVHGWNSNGNSNINPMIKDAFLAVQDCNVIVVDWRRYANMGYNSAARAVPSVGQHIGQFVQWLINTAGGNWNNVHFVGFSLGAHAVGNAGRTVGNRAARVTERLNVLYERNWTRLVHEQLRKFETSIVAAARQSEAQPAELALDSKWTFSGAVIYCITLITTIGYGNVSPRTAAGRAATVAYAAAGVPLTLACLAGLGASLARLARIAWLKATKNKPPSTWKKDGEMENHFQLHEQQRLLPQSAENNQYTIFPPRHRSPGTVRARAGERGQYSQVFERAPASPRAATLGRMKRNALADEPHSSSSLQTQTLDRKRSISSSKCLATVHGPGRGRGRGVIQRPRGPVIEQLIAEECGELNRSLEDLDDSEDTDDAICPHDTPSRVPLIWKEELNHKSKSCNVPSSSASTSVQHHINPSVEHCHIPVAIVLFLLLAYICVGAALFSAWENWSFLDAAYFCFIALATIGFGDFVPTSFLTSKPATDSSKSEYVQMIACCAYLVFGLILIAMSFSLLQDEVVSRCSQIANSLGLSRQ